ncbi:metalloregulator ArsR/SmtB family transcription factor [Stappia sp. F7233]|uniref:Metalloregulator ArsR/SmtB family transcription factor n=1 Tax=Stappia albiluteola TaxID=2758565 RepID=A0A839ADU2_9HYPH|nr:metalloregulator ArsR/SmtB family transcription factor [Stappia albiluteola]MBA5777853.1 metalloregulator ArsR/SmtB family transcription factor [Stappia albiluteola]
MPTTELTTPTVLSLDQLLAGLKTVGEPTRLRLIALLAEGELTVKDATAILGQSQPRISRHLKLLTEAGLIQRFPEGSWVFYRLGEAAMGRFARDLLLRLDPDEAILAADRMRLQAIRKAKAEEAARYFAARARTWDQERSLHVPEVAVEGAVHEMVGTRPFDALLDLGTGTGRLLELFSGQYARALGVDASHDMLSVARANLARAGVSHAQVRHGDIYALTVPRESFDVVCIHQVLHFLDDPSRAVAEAARTLRPGGRLLIVDFAPHDFEFLREAHAHRRLGFSHDQMSRWLEEAGLDVVQIRDLMPDDGEGGKLTVTLWLAQDPRVITDLPQKNSTREVA